AMLPVYGLAEATLAVTFPPLGELPRTERLNRQLLQTHQQAIPTESDNPYAICFASEGFPAQGCEVRIVNGEDQRVSDGIIGHIQIRGDNVTQGYYSNLEATQEAFCGSWLRTGDLGFIREGRLCVTGRTKDILFVNGQNYYAHDLENIAQQVEGVQAGKVAVCGWHDLRTGRENVLLFLASHQPASSVSLFLQVKRRLQRVLGLTVDIIANNIKLVESELSNCEVHRPAP
ncbi:MAG: AMP-binding protein, partial [Nitrospira sp.]|nr:AMP-binding protein [Nitrospira sp.]